MLRIGAGALLAQEVEAKVAEFLAQHADLRTTGGLRRVVRHGYLPEREVMTGIGAAGARSLGCASLGYASMTLAMMPGAFASRRRSCRATRGARAALRKTADVLNKLPKSQQPKAKRSLQEIWMAETGKDAEAAFDAFIAAYQPKYDKAAACLAKDRQARLAFYDFPAEHWKHLRTSNPIESTFATVRHRTIRSKGCLSNKTALAMVFKLVDAARKSWRRLAGHNQLPKLIQGVRFTDGIKVAANPASSKAQTAAA